MPKSYDMAYILMSFVTGSIFLSPCRKAGPRDCHMSCAERGNENAPFSLSVTSVWLNSKYSHEKRGL